MRSIVPIASVAAAVCAFATLALAPSSVLAADVAFEQAEVPEAIEVRDIIVDLGLGVQYEPKFPSSEDYEARPWPIFALRFLRLPVFGEVVDGQPRVFSIYPSINFIGSRDEDDADYLLGTEDVDFAFEVGPGVALRYGFVRAFAEARYGITGHDGFVFDLGADLIFDQHERIEVAFGPRVSLATDDVMDTYFGVEPGALFLPAYDPDGGFKDVGVEAQASYAITENLRVLGKASYTRFVGDAEDSPIVEAGNVDEFRVGIGLSYRFGLDLY